MPMESLSLGAPHPRYDIVDRAELPPPNHDNVPQPNGHQSDANYSTTYNGQHHADHGYEAQYRGNLWYEGLPPPASDLEGQYTHEPNPGIGYALPGNADHMSADHGPPRREHYYIPPAHASDLPNNGIRDRPPPIPEVATDPFSQNVPNPGPSRMSATEDLKRLMSRYLENPDSQVDTFRVGLSPSGSRLRVMIMLDIDI